MEDHFITILISVAGTLRRVKPQSNVLLDIACTVRTPYTEDPVISTVVLKFQEEMHSIYFILKYLDEMMDVNREMVNKFSGYLGASRKVLKTIVNGHVQDHTMAHRDKENKTLAQGMSSDDWQVKDFTAKDNKILKRIPHSALRIRQYGPGWVRSGRPFRGGT
ncbi:hypothetical protein F4859DRAFT_511261 [Xylaria cf. heliscus]|nr:hypothetical protein F4859DRAFT_511261 [Xylaria cf. heliscus]